MAPKRARAAATVDSDSVSSAPECAICCQTTAVRNTLCECPYCGHKACEQCVTTFILGAETDAGCMNCRRPFSLAQLQSMLRVSFMQGPYRAFRERLLLARENALLPNTVTVARLVRAAQDLGARRADLVLHAYRLPNWTVADVTAQNAQAWTQTLLQMTQTLQTAAQTQAELKEAEAELFGPQNTAPPTTAPPTTAPPTTQQAASENVDQPEKTVYTMPCPRDECAGFLNARHVCGICNTRVCEKCHAKLEATEHGDGHECRKEDVASVALVRRETKACPRCSARVFKTGGCDQMFCTACNTAFSWSTLQIVTRGIHNPHYFEWLFRTGGRGDEDEHGGRAVAAQPAAHRAVVALQAARDNEIAIRTQAPPPAQQPLECVNTAQDWIEIGNRTYDNNVTRRAVNAARDFFVGRFIQARPRAGHYRHEFHDHLNINLADFTRRQINRQTVAWMNQQQGRTLPPQRQHPLPPSPNAFTLMMRYLEEVRMLEENYGVAQGMNGSADVVEQGARTVANALGPHAAESFRRYREHERTRIDITDPRAQNEDLRILRLLGRLDNVQFQRELVLREARRAREQERLQLAALYIDVCAQTLHALTNELIANPVWRPQGYEESYDAADVAAAVARQPGRAQLLASVENRLRAIDELRVFVNDRAREASLRTQRATIRIAQTGELAPLVVWQPRARQATDNEAEQRQTKRGGRRQRARGAAERMMQTATDRESEDDESESENDA